MKSLMLLFAASVCILASCGSTEIGNSKDVNPATVYMKYDLYGSERDSVTFKAQFSFAGPEGTTLVLNAPAKIELDGDSIPVDSAGGEGAFYQVVKPAKAFEGKHIVTFTGTDSIAITNFFAFSALKLADSIPKRITLAGLPLTFTGLKNIDSIHISVTDNSKIRDIDTVLAVINGKTFLAGKAFKKLKNGPLTIQIGQYYTVPLEKTTKQGGSFTLWNMLGERKTMLRK